MADGLTGGFTNAANVQHALGMFLRLAWPQRKDIAQAHVRDKRGSPSTILNNAVLFLDELAQSDGRQDDFKRRKIADGSPAVRTDPRYNAEYIGAKNFTSIPKASGSKANMAVVGRKWKPTKMQRRRSMVCYICSEEGHTAKFHRQHLSKTAEEPDDSQAQGNSAVAEDDSETDVLDDSA
ncbi:hypothetical protein PHMEG_0007242 [Phytophthora megakarya]|uniref:Uncharacterized protein n=1 Tax=Phytophthora megakarya TaxID=4795 RepID=A0A225WMC6_9STRA|nr:hypothetical protein PHMEG_0007242 [Phytophthora megakarya]